jgi:hypothetical protein
MQDSDNYAGGSAGSACSKPAMFSCPLYPNLHQTMHLYEQAVHGPKVEDPNIIDPTASMGLVNGLALCTLSWEQ